MLRLPKKRFLFRTLLALLFLAATQCGQFLYGIHAQNAAMQDVVLPTHELPSAGSTVLVIAPHCDDETLAAGGMIAAATRRGAQVTVAFVTNGDGFPMAVSREYRRLRPRPEDYRRMARHRQKEARAALARLGVPRKQILFLGYPDAGIAELWNRHWQPDRPYRSRFTGCSVSPYTDGFRPEAVYCGRDLMQDLETLLRQVRPQWLYIPHSGDDHTDHWATHCFAVAALEELRKEAAQTIGPVWPGGEWNAPRVHTYLVHRGDWPVPQGLRRGARLVPPAPMAHLDTHWSTLTLTGTAQADKEAALLCYRSQTAVMKRFLTSFLRRDELFGSLPPSVESSVLRVESSDRDMASLPLSQLSTLNSQLPPHWQTAITDSTRDTLIRDLQGSGDFAAVDTNLVADRLRLRVTTRRPLSSRVTYTVRLHPLGRGAANAEPITIPFRRLRCDTPVVFGECRRSEIEVSVPLALLGHPTAVLVGADSRLGRVPIDRVCWRLLRLPASSPLAVRLSF